VTSAFYRAGSSSRKPRSGTQSEPRAHPAPRSGIACRCWRDCLDLPERPAPLDKLMTKDKARKIAAGIAKLPELLKRPQY
jgi:hypothetical protein